MIKIEKNKKFYGFLLVILAVFAIGSFYGYQKIVKPKYAKYQSEKEFVFEIKNNNLPPAVLDNLRQQFDEAVAEAKGNSSLINPWNSLGSIKKIIGDLEGAERAWLYANQINPKNSLSFGNLGELYGFNWHQFDKSEKMYLQAIANEPTDPNWYSQLSEVYKDWPEKKELTEKILLQGLAAIPDSPNLVALLAGFYKETGQTEKAIAYYEKLVKLSPDNQAAKEDLAELKQK